MIQALLTFLIVQCMFIITGVVGGIEVGTFEAGLLCFLSQLIGVIVAVVEFVVRLNIKTTKSS